MGGAFSKGKGSSFEREVCKMLSLWVTAGAKSDLYWRAAMSGGRATLGMKKGEQHRISGDIASVSPEGHVLTDQLHIECKHYQELDFAQFFIKDRGTLKYAWATCIKQADFHGKQPMLIARQNRYPIVVVTLPGTQRWRGDIIECDKWEVVLFERMIDVPFRLNQPHLQRTTLVRKHLD
jgi:hypothetical protein